MDRKELILKTVSHLRVKTWTREGQFCSELLTEDLDEAMAHVKAEVRIGHEVKIETEPNGEDD